MNIHWKLQKTEVWSKKHRKKKKNEKKVVNFTEHAGAAVVPASVKTLSTSS